MIDRETFLRHVSDALKHLDDPFRLDTHPLARLVLTRDEAATPGTIRRVLLDAVERLRPDGSPSPQSTRWRQYRHLIMRYVEGRTAGETAELLSVSLRQAQRDHQLALESLCSVLWSRYCRLRQSPAHWPAEPCLPAGDLPSAAAQEELEDELLRIGLTPPDGPTDLPEIVREAVVVAAGLLRSLGMRLEMRLPPGIAPVDVNAAVLRHVLLSLLNWTAGQPGCSRVTLAARETTGWVELLIRLASDPAPASLSAQPPSAACRLIEMQGGSLVLGTGSGGSLELCLRLPCAVSTTVLVVDDNPDAVRLIQRYLAAGGYRALEAGTAQQALHVAAEAFPDAIILDVMLPSVDGLELLRRLRSSAPSRETPVIVCSVLPEEALARSLGATEFLGKPFSPEALLAALRRHCPSPAPSRRSPPADTRPDPGSTARPVE